MLDRWKKIFGFRSKMAWITNTRVQPRCSCTRVPICRHVRAHMVAEGAGSRHQPWQKGPAYKWRPKIRKLANFVQHISPPFRLWYIYMDQIKFLYWNIKCITDIIRGFIENLFESVEIKWKELISLKYMPEREEI